MSEQEKKGSAWPWIAVPIAAVSVFFLLRECQHRLPPAARPAGSSATTAPVAAAGSAESAIPTAAPTPQ